MGYTRVDATIGAQDIMILVPDGYNASVGAPLILYHHGSGEDATAMVTDAKKADCVAALTGAGYLLAGADAQQYGWGNDASLADYEALYTYVVTNYNVTSVHCWGQSMGGLSGLLSVADGIIPYISWLGTYPYINLQYAYDNGFAEYIEDAYGLQEGGSDYAAGTAGHDPCLMDGTAFTIRLRFYASEADAKAQNTDTFHAIIDNFAIEHVVVTCTGIHGDESHFQPADYLAFFNRAITETMMTTALPAVKNAAFTYYTGLVSQADTDVFKTTPTLAAGDVLISKDGEAFGNITSLPTEIASTGVLTVALTATEMNADTVTVLFHDVAGAEWQDQMATIYTAGQTFDATDRVVDSILVDTGTDGVVVNTHTVTGKSEINAEVVDVLRTDTIPDSYAADGAQPTFAQAILAIQQYLQERSVSGTTVTVKKPDGSTTAMTFTLNDGSNPTSQTRAS